MAWSGEPGRRISSPASELPAGGSVRPATELAVAIGSFEVEAAVGVHLLRDDSISANYFQSRSPTELPLRFFRRAIVALPIILAGSIARGTEAHENEVRFRESGIRATFRAGVETECPDSQRQIYAGATGHWAHKLHFTGPRCHPTRGGAYDRNRAT